MDELIGREAVRINAATFGAFFGGLQVILGRYVILSAAQLFEKPSERHPTRSVPAVIRFLRDHSKELVVEQRESLLRSLSRLGAPVQELRARPDPELTRFVADFFEQQFSHVDLEGTDNAQALVALKGLRDKVVAHSEAVRVGDLPKPTYSEIDKVVALARVFVGAVAGGYLTVGYEDDSGDSSISRDAQRATTSLQRLLERAGILPADRVRA